MTSSRFISCFITGLLFAAPAALRADGTNAPTEGPRPAPHLRPGGQFNEAGLAVGGPVGVLTSQQLASYETAMNAQRARLAELQARLQAARHDLTVTSVTQKYDETVIREKAMGIAKIEAEMMVLRIKVFSQVQPPLTPDQIEKIKANQPGPVRPLNRQGFERPPRRDVPANTNANHDENGLPPKQ